MSESKSSSHTSTSTSSESIISSSPIEIYDVVVVGAGPIGLATAIGLRKRGIENILVVDQARAFRQVGHGLDLLPNGLKALKHIDCDAYEEVKKASISFFKPKQSHSENTVETTLKQKPPKTSPKWVYKNLQGQLIRSVPLGFDDWLKIYGEGRLSIPWYDLQTTLKNLLPEDRVKANHRCIDVIDEPQNQCVRILCISDAKIETNLYAHWADPQKYNDTQPQISDVEGTISEIKSIRAKLVVAADGINSTIRQVLYKDSIYHNFAQPEYSGFAAISCMEIAEIPNKLEKELEEKFFQDSSIMTLINDQVSTEHSYAATPRLLLFRKRSGQVGYILNLALPLDLLQNKSGSYLINLAVQELEKAGFPSEIKKLVSISPPCNIQERPFYIHRAIISDPTQNPGNTDFNIQDHLVEIQPPWSAGRVVLVGDAAHGMPPFNGQGANQGFEDVLTVAAAIANIAQKNNWDDKQAIATAFEKYERIRRPFVAYIQHATLTCFAHSSNEKWQEFQQQVHCRNFDQAIEALVPPLS
jgi:2-polyprenyl-6-methoxyphenol hydroxylase-like FAD-dependent oxidoreductase